MDLIIDALRRWNGGGRSRARTEIVLPDGRVPVPADAAERIDLLKVELCLGSSALLYSAVPVVALKFAQADPEVLSASLARALAVHLVFAGRLAVDLATGDGHVKLTHVGVPFTVVEAPEASAPAVLKEVQLLGFADVRNPRKILKGWDPVLTVKLTTYRDGSAVLCLAHAHTLADGTYMWAFMAAWAQAARGEPMPVEPVSQDRGPWKLLKQEWSEDVEKAQALNEEIFGSRLEQDKWWMVELFARMFQASDVCFFAGFSKATARRRVFFSDDDVARIKEAATPPPGDGDGWVTTQEAIAAHILLALAHVILPLAKPHRSVPRCGVWFMLDVRRRLSMAADQASGAGFTSVQVVVDDPLRKSLPEVATVIHNHLKLEVTDRHVLKRWISGGSAADHEMLADVFQKQVLQKGQHAPYDLLLELNNQSKRVLPDFGPGGGVPTAALTQGGPSLLYPATGGTELFLHADTFMGAPAEKVEEALAAVAKIP